MSKHGLQKTKHIIEYAARKAVETNFQMQHFGAVLSYESRALAELEQPRPWPAATELQRNEPQQPDPVWTEGERRLSMLTADQVAARLEKVKAELAAANPFFARHSKDNSASLDTMARGRLIRQLAAEPMELVILPTCQLNAMCHVRHAPAQNLPL